MQPNLLPRGVYVFPVLDSATLRPVVFLVSQHQTWIHHFPTEAGETTEAALARGRSLLELLDPPPVLHQG